MVRCVLIRTGAFSLGASSLLALLPLVARPHGASGYGLLLGSFGLGALGGASVLHRLRSRLSVDGVVAFAIVVFAAMTFAAGQVQNFGWLSLILFLSGTAWIGILACLNVAAQTMSPSFLRARTLSVYLLVLQGGMAIGSALVGCSRQPGGGSDRAAVVGICHGGGAGGGAAVPADFAGTGAGAGGRAGLGDWKPSPVV